MSHGGGTGILLTSVGHQVELVAAFRKAFAAQGTVVAADADRSAPALDAADEVLVAPPWSSDPYLPWIRSVSAEHGIRLVITLHECELAVLETIRSDLAAAGTVLAGTPNVPVANLMDKYVLARDLRAVGIPCPETRLAREVVEGTATFDGPVTVKPRSGRGSLGVRFVDRSDEVGLVVPAGALDRFVAQPTLVGDEYGVDVVNDLEGRFRAALVRRKLRMRHGETDRAEAARVPALEEIARRLSSFTRHSGLMDTDVFMTEAGPLLLDVNPRFGGGYLFSHVAGADVPAALAAWLRGDDDVARYLDYEAGAIAQRSTSVAPVGERSIVV